MSVGKGFLLGVAGGVVVLTALTIGAGEEDKISKAWANASSALDKTSSVANKLASYASNPDISETSTAQITSLPQKEIAIVPRHQNSSQKPATRPNVPQNKRLNFIFQKQNPTASFASLESGLRERVLYNRDHSIYSFNDSVMKMSVKDKDTKQETAIWYNGITTNIPCDESRIYTYNYGCIENVQPLQP